MGMNADRDIIHQNLNAQAASDRWLKIQAGSKKRLQ